MSFQAVLRPSLSWLDSRRPGFEDPRSSKRSSVHAALVLVLVLAALGLLLVVAPARADGIDWVAREAAEANAWASVAHGDGVWVAVSQDGTDRVTNRVMRSTDKGANWTSVTGDPDGVGAPPAEEWRSVAHGDGVWVAVSQNGTNRVMRSTDKGVRWTSATAAAANQWQSVAYGDGVWVAVASSGGVDGTGRVMRSDDKGVTWTPAKAATGDQWLSVAYGDGVWVAVSVGGAVMRSTDKGVNWAHVTGDGAPPANNWRSVAYGDGVWVAVASSGTDRVTRSTDKGVTWTSATAAAVKSWQSVAYGSGVWVAIASLSQEVMRSTDGGVSWTAVDPASGNLQWASVGYGDGVWVSVAANGNPPETRVRTSEAPILAVASQPSETVLSGEELPRQPQVTLTGASPRAGVTVTVALAAGDGVLGGTLTAVTAADGAATFSDLSITGPQGTYELVFSAPGALPVTSDVINVTVQIAVEQSGPAPAVSCVPVRPQVGSAVTCQVTGGDPGIEILWRAAYNPVFAEAGLTLGSDGSGTFSFVVPAAALGETLTVELVEWTQPMTLGVVGGPVPASVPAGEGSVPFGAVLFALFAAAGAVVAGRRLVTAG